MRDLSLDWFKGWLDAYGAAWEKGEARAASELFSDNAEYYETPFEKPMIGRAAIHKYWQEGAGDAQRDIHFSYDVTALSANRGLAQWRASFVRVPSGRRVELDGILSAEFDDAGHCRVFREWWHRQENDTDSSP